MTSLYNKSTDYNQYLCYKSSHPEHIKQFIIYSETFRIRRVCYQVSDFKKHPSKLKSWFLKRSYLKKITDTEMKKVLDDKNKKVNNKTEKGISFTVTYI